MVHGTSKPVTYSGLCAAALTHPVTLGALAILLLNDWVLKALWSNPWTTGKLSDLAWVVFASPLLAWLLSLAARDNRLAQRAGWWTAYAGLPLLYVAFNTFAVVHEVILGGISLLAGVAASSPLDPTDSLVIPLGLGVAILVWRRGMVSASDLRYRMTAVLACVAIIASVATSPPQQVRGIVEFGVTAEGGVVAGEHGCYGLRFSEYDSPECGFAVSTDGGLTWSLYKPEGESWPYTPDGGLSSEQTVETPRGLFVIRGTDVVQVDHGGGTKVVYSAGYVATDVGRWMQERSDVGRGEVVVSNGPESLVYDLQTNHVIVGMGTQGVVVGMPGGHWTEVSVGENRPTILSKGNRMRVFFGVLGSWYAILLLPVVGSSVVVSLGLVLARWCSPDAPTKGAAWGYGGLALSVLAVAIGVFVWALRIGFGQDGLTDLVGGGVALAGAWAAATSVFLCVGGIRHWREQGIKLVSWVDVLISISAMTASTLFVSLLWLQAGLSTDLATGCGLVLVSLVIGAQVAYLLSGSRLRAPSEERTY